MDLMSLPTILLLETAEAGFLGKNHRHAFDIKVQCTAMADRYHGFLDKHYCSKV